MPSSHSPPRHQPVVPSPLSNTPPAPPPPYRSSSTLLSPLPPATRSSPAPQMSHPMSHPMPPHPAAPPIVPAPTVHHPPPQAPSLALPPHTPHMAPAPAPGPHTPSPQNPVLQGYAAAPPVSPHPHATAPQPMPPVSPYVVPAGAAVSPQPVYPATATPGYYAAPPPPPGVLGSSPGPAPMTGLTPYSDQQHPAAQAPARLQSTTSAPISADGKANVSAASPLLLLAVGDFKDMRKDVQPVPEESVTCVEDGGKRLRRLKDKLNELQDVRSSYWTKQGAAAGAGAVGAIMTLGVAVAATGVTAYHNRNRLEQIKKSMRDVIQQINKLRNVFGKDPTWHRYEKTVLINTVVFSKGMDRSELYGDL